MENFGTLFVSLTTKPKKWFLEVVSALLNVLSPCNYTEICSHQRFATIHPCILSGRGERWRTRSGEKTDWQEIDEKRAWSSRGSLSQKKLRWNLFDTNTKAAAEHAGAHALSHSIRLTGSQPVTGTQTQAPLPAGGSMASDWTQVALTNTQTARMLALQKQTHKGLQERKKTIPAWTKVQRALPIGEAPKGCRVWEGFPLNSK